MLACHDAVCVVVSHLDCSDDVRRQRWCLHIFTVLPPARKLTSQAFPAVSPAVALDVGLDWCDGDRVDNGSR
jgi:hypothetical protein